MNQKLLSVRMGEYTLSEEGHTVILKWNRHVPSILRQIAKAREDVSREAYRGPIVVISEKDKAWMDAEIEEALEGCRPLNVLIRSAKPHDMLNLQRASAGLACTVMLLQPTGNIEDAGLVKAYSLAALRSLSPAGVKQTILSESRGHLEGKDDYCQMTAEALHIRFTHPACEFVEVGTDVGIQRLIGQCAAEPWLARVWTELLNITFETCEIYVQRFPFLEGCSYRDALCSFPTATVIGYHSALQGCIRINPPDTDLIKEGDSLVALSQTLGEFRLRSTPLPAELPSSRTYPGRQPGLCASQQPSHILVIGWKPEMHLMISGIDAFVQKVHAAVMLLTHMMRRASRPAPHVLAILRNRCTIDILQAMVGGHPGGAPVLLLDTMLADELASGLIAQVAVEKRLLLVLQDLFSAGPNKVRVSAATQYLPDSLGADSDWQALSFAEVTEVARLRGETAIGFMNSQHEMRMCPADLKRWKDFFIDLGLSRIRGLP